jgi:hypothetical protein
MMILFQQHMDAFGPSRPDISVHPVLGLSVPPFVLRIASEFLCPLYESIRP